MHDVVVFAFELRSKVLSTYLLISFQVRTGQTW